MSAEQNKALVRRMYAAFDAADLAAVPAIFGPAWVNNDPSLPPLSGHDGARQLISMFTQAFSDFTTTIESILAEGDRVAARFSHTGTHQGEFMGIQPTGRRISVSSSGIFRIADGRVVENRVVFDALGLLQQLGVMPAAVPE